MDLEELIKQARKQFAASGGKARAKKLTKKRRSEIAAAGGKALAEKRRRENAA